MAVYIDGSCISIHLVFITTSRTSLRLSVSISGSDLNKPPAVHQDEQKDASIEIDPKNGSQDVKFQRDSEALE